MNSRIGIACAGGGIEGAVYEIGALCALEEAIQGLDFTKMHVYVGVSAGALICSSLVNHITPRQMSLGILSHQEGVHPITPEIFYTPDIGEYFSKVTRIPGVLLEAIQEYIINPGDISLSGSLSRLSKLLPVGIFNNEPLEEYVRTNLAMTGRTNRFQELETVLRIIATDLNSGQTVVFGKEPYADVTISKAVQASSALPFVYTPVKIGDRYYMDGVARRTVHASVALEEGADLVICINPIVPYEAIENDFEIKDLIRKNLVDEGLPAVLSQTFRTMIHSRMGVGIKNYGFSYPGRDIMLIEPGKEDYRMFFTNIFSFNNRKEVCEYAYQTTRKQLLERAGELEPLLLKHGLTLRTHLLRDTGKTLYDTFEPGDSEIKRTLGKTLFELDQLLDRLDRTV
jgi:NTE family protein